MRKLALGAVCAAAAISAMSASAETPRHTFTFDTTLQNSEGTAVLTSHGGSIVAGNYVFGTNEGLSLDNALADPAIYSIEMRVLMDDLSGSSYKKLIDFQEQTSDNGLYYRLGQLRFYIDSPIGADTVAAGEWATVVLTRDADGTLTGYLNGVQQWSLPTELGVSAGNTLDFLRDDAATSFFEASSGQLDYLRIYDTALSATDVAALTAPAATVVERDLFTPGDGLLTYDPNTGNEWLDLNETIEESVNGINAGNGGWTDLGFRVATRSELLELWSALDIVESVPELTENFPGAVAYHQLIGCTWLCTNPGFKQSNGLVLRENGTGVWTTRVDLFDTETDPSSRAFFPGVAGLDFTNFTSGVHLVRSAASADSDNDGVADGLDNCTEVFNADQRDSNADGFGNECDADLNNDGIVNAVDLGLLRVAFFTDDADADLNGDGTVNIVDLGRMRSLFFSPPGPSGLAP